VRPDAPTTSNAIKSLVPPKGYFINIFGAFMKKYFTQVKAQVSMLNDGDNMVDKTTNANESCSVQFSYWKMKVTVRATNYVKITKLMPSFVTALIMAQTSKFKKGEVTKTLTKCQSELNSFKTQISSFEVTLTTLQQTKINYESTLKILQEKSSTYKLIIIGKIKPENWHGNGQKYIALINQLKQDNIVLEKKIAELKAKIEDIKTQIYNRKKEITEYNTLITTYKTEMTTTTTSIDTELNILKTLENDQANKVARYTHISQETQNLEVQRKSIEEQIKQFQARLVKIGAKIDENKKIMVTTEEEIGTIKEKEKVQIKKIEQIKVTKTSYETKIKTTQEKITTTDIEIHRLDGDSISYLNQINVLTVKIQANNMEIEKYEKYSQDDGLDDNSIQYYKTELVKIENDIISIKSKLSITIEEINKLNIKISSSNSQISTKTDCVDNNTKLIKQYTAQFDQDRAAVYKIYEQIKAIYGEQLSYVVKTIESLNEIQTVEAFIADIKRNLHEYLDALPSDPKIMSQITMNLDRRRRLRRRRILI